MRTSVPGVATGLAWTPVGGDILFIESTRTPGTGKLILTGQLGDVMKESAQAALSLVKAQSVALGIDPTLFERSDIHIHVPAGGIPKDGPSAGVSMFTSLVSLLTDKTVRNDVAMTGEISLRGLVLPIGGVKEKSIAAHRAGIRTVVLPARNRKDLEDIPASVKADMEFVFCERVEDVVHTALDWISPRHSRCRTKAEPNIGRETTIECRPISHIDSWSCYAQITDRIRRRVSGLLARVCHGTCHVRFGRARDVAAARKAAKDADGKGMASSSDQSRRRMLRGLCLERKRRTGRSLFPS
jgi:hypothetical protein